MSKVTQIKKIYHAAIYVRLSKEDGAVASHAKAESNSIANQKSLIKEFLKGKQDIVIEQEYVDDGFSGSTFERPAFQMMLEDIKRGKINCVVTKDLSRFGREYIDSGMYIERLFPAMGVRFIAINDGIDSGNEKSQADEVIIPFKNLINDAYCRDISIKIRSHLEIKRKQGEVISAFVAYGYKKCEDDKHKIEIDLYAANVVKDIFRLKLHGKSQDAIASELNSMGILPPAEYKASLGSNYQTRFKTKEKSEWTSVMVRRILTNEIYIGNLVQGKQTTPNHKVKKTILKEESDWVRIEKNHDPIVTDRDFEVVQRLLSMDTRTSPDQNEVYPLSGIVTCGTCGVPMVRKTSKVGGKTYAYYLCATHKDTKQCSSHRIATDKLEAVVLEMLQVHIANILELKKVLQFIGNVPFQQLDMKKLEERRDKKQAEVDRCSDLRAMLYEDMKDGIITKEDYKELHAAYENRKKNAEIAIHQIEMEMEDVLNRKSKGFLWLDYFTENQNISELTREVAVSLIREIKVIDKEHIEIIFDFDDAYMESAHEESNSITHQRKLMLDHIATIPELRDSNILEFADDGYSGASFDRPEFQKMMQLVKAGKIQVIVTKDYSRLGRDYLEVGNYMEYIFPTLQIRYISVNDQYDSDKSMGATGGMGVALKNLVNAMYVRDASKKVRAAKAVLARQGKYIASFAPFGYKKSDVDKHVLVPDENAAPVVKLIFQLAIKGMKYTEIANYLNENGYDSILTYLDKIGQKRCLTRDIGLRMWGPTTVMQILFNEAYIGSVVNNKSEDNIDTAHKVIRKDTTDWIVVKDCHEPLISKEDYKLAHKMIARREYTPRNPNGTWKQSLYRCGICGKGLNKYGSKKDYRCHNGHVSRIRRTELENAIMDMTRTMALSQLQELELKQVAKSSSLSVEKEIENLKKTKAHYSKLKFEIYDEYSKGNLSREMMASKTAAIKEKVAQIDQQIESKAELLMEEEDLYQDAKQETYSKISKLAHYEEEAVRALIDHVVIYDNEHIEINWNFDDMQVCG